VRSLKQKLDSTEAEIDNLRSHSTIMNEEESRKNEKTKNKLRKYESYLRTAMQALRKIGHHLSSQTENVFLRASKSGADTYGKSSKR